MKGNTLRGHAILMISDSGQELRVSKWDMIDE